MRRVLAIRRLWWQLFASLMMLWLLADLSLCLLEPVFYKPWQRLHPGMSQKQVRDLLGPPNDITQIDSNAGVWDYTKMPDAAAHARTSSMEVWDYSRINGCILTFMGNRLIRGERPGDMGVFNKDFERKRRFRLFP